MKSKVDLAKEDVCARVGANVYGRLECIQRYIELGQDDMARLELLRLLKFFPPEKKPK